MSGLRAITICVDMSDLLNLTLPRQRPLFSEVMIVTTPTDEQTRAVASHHGAIVHETDAFFRDGATFGKWQALEEGLDAFGRKGWICVLDADVIWPAIQIAEGPGWLEYSDGDWVWRQMAGQLCAPLRRMFERLPVPFTAAQIPPEHLWDQFPIHRNVNEHAGYSLVLHASDPHAAQVPWFEPWKNAGASDSFFQRRWPASQKVRPPFHCLHLGPAGQNWHGRSTPLLDGTILPGSEARRQACADIWTARRRNRASGDEFKDERI